MNYRIILSERPGRGEGLDIDFDKTLFELFVEIEGQIYRVVRSQVKDEPVKPLIGDMFQEIANQLKIPLDN